MFFAFEEVINSGWNVELLVQCGDYFETSLAHSVPSLRAICIKSGWKIENTGRKTRNLVLY